MDQFDLKHAFAAPSLIRDIRRVLQATSDIADELDRVIDRVNEYCRNTHGDHLPTVWNVMKNGLSVMASQARCIAFAQSGNDDLLAEQARKDFFLAEFRRELRSEALVVPATLEATRGELCEADAPDSAEIRRFLQALPVPALYFTAPDESFPENIEPALEIAPSPEEDAPVPLVRVIAFLDHAPLVTPQLVKADLIYPLELRIRGLGWPEEATSLRFDLLTTCPREEYSVSSFVLDRPETNRQSEYEAQVSGHIKFNSAQSSLLDDLVFIFHAAFELPEQKFQEIQVIGHHELRLRVTNQQQHPFMSGNRRLDRHVEELLTKLLQECRSVRDELDDLIPVLHAITLLLATYAQEAIYKGVSEVLEQDFQSLVLRDLRIRLGQDVQEHTTQAGGPADIRFRGVIIELKVERKNGDRQHICQKYTAQATQYAGVEARQVSVLLVLDLSAKDVPPGDIRNDILLTDVETHGGDSGNKPFPSKAFVFVVNGNMKNPSEYSR